MATRTQAALLLVLFIAAPASAERLPTTVVPDHYDLAFDVDIEHARFDGTETIHVRVDEPTKRIVLNALEIDVHDATIEAGGATQKAVVAFDAKAETASLTVPQTIAKGPADIHIRYTGQLNNKLRGFYLSKGATRNYAVT